MKTSNQTLRKGVYAPPLTLRNCVETEGGICESVNLTNDNETTGTIKEHEINQDGPTFKDNDSWTETSFGNK